MKINIKVIPNSSRDIIVGWLDLSLKIKVKAPAQSGKANKAILALMAKTLNIPLSQIHIFKGHSQAYKVLEIDCKDELPIKQKLESMTK